MIERSDVLPDDTEVLQAAQAARQVYDALVLLNDAISLAKQEGCTVRLFQSSSLGSTAIKLNVTVTMPMVRFKQERHDSYIEMREPEPPGEEEDGKT